MTGYARPELLASTDWLAEQLGRPEVRILDVRWRPDGSARDIYASGHVPGAVHVDWRQDLIADPVEGSNALLLAPPEQVTAVLSAAGVGDGTTIVLYDDTLSLYAARVWWSLLAYGFESVRLLDGGWIAWLAEGRPVSNAVAPPASVAFTPRSNARVRLTTADVRGALGSPDVQILDARAPAEYRGLEGNAKRLGHIPGAINLPVGSMRREGSQHLRDGDGLRARPDAEENALNPHRSLRGGSHAHGPSVVAAGHRNDDVRSSASRSIGFRVARPVDKVERGAPAASTPVADGPDRR